MAGARQAQGRVRLRVAPIGLEFCGRRSAWAGLGLHLNWTLGPARRWRLVEPRWYRICWTYWPGKALAFVV